uniref:SDR family oxidoreductase n=1 Tax=Rhabditophanes sp. KR3021 TaxID=114890 RepID=A0AC35TGT2_9BILA
MAAAVPQTLAGNVSLITNITTPFGYAIARRLGFAGSRLFVTGTCKGKTERAIKTLQDNGIDVAGACLDITKSEERAQLPDLVDKEYGKLDSLVISHLENRLRGNLLDCSVEEVKEMYDKYLVAPFDVSKKLFPLLQKSDNGSIVLMSSIAGFTPFNDIGLYSTAQTAILGLTKNLAQSMAHMNVRVNSVSTGFMTDDNSGASWDQASEELRLQLETVIPLGRVAKMYEATGTVEFLLGRNSSYISGENMILNGGMSVRI